MNRHGAIVGKIGCFNSKDAAEPSQKALLPKETHRSAHGKTSANTAAGVSASSSASAAWGLGGDSSKSINSLKSTSSSGTDASHVRDSARPDETGTPKSVLGNPQLIYIEPRWPFNKLAILGEEQEATPGYNEKSGNAREGGSSRELRPVVSYRPSVGARSAYGDSEAGESGGSGRLKELNSFQSTSSGGDLPNSRSSRSSLRSLQEAGSHQGATASRASLAQASERISEEGSNRSISEEGSNHLASALPARHSADGVRLRPYMQTSTSVADVESAMMSSQLYPTVPAEVLEESKRRFSLGNHFRCNKKKRQLCRWDLAPAVRLVNLSAPLALPPGLKLQRENLASNCCKTKDNMVPISWGKVGEIGGSVHGDVIHEVGSPTGPLSVDFSETGSSADGELAHTFDMPDTDVDVAHKPWNEQSTSESSDNWQNSSTEASHGRTQISAPARMEGPSPVRQQLIPRSSTLPDLSLESDVKSTARFRIERFRGLTFVNEYILVQTIGRGSFGKVKLALNTQDQNLYALKLIPKSRRRQRSSSAAARSSKPVVTEDEVQQEINVMKSLVHPNVVRLDEVIDDPMGSKLLMVMEYVEGGPVVRSSGTTLQNRLSELAARKYFRNILQGLDYLHAKHVVHGDLKPDNLLLAADGTVKIADFGSSRLMAACDVVSRTAGTPAFMSPEMCSGAPYHARLADVWALGICLYMFIYGTVPFKADNMISLYDKICNEPLELPTEPFVSDSLRHLITRLLDRDPETRISLVSTMRHPWITHNGALPLESAQVGTIDDEDEEVPESLLMECWPESPGELGMDAMVQTLCPAMQEHQYADGEFLVEQGSLCSYVIFVEEGNCEITYTLKEQDGSDDDEDNDAEEAVPKNPPGRPPLKRRGSMLKTMFCATWRASSLVSAVRNCVNGNKALIATRGPGQFIGEIMMYEKGGNDVRWQTSVRAKGPVKALLMHHSDMKELTLRRPELEADLRAVIAQRKAELLKMETLEKLASLHREMHEEVKLAASATNGAVDDAANAQMLLSCAAKKQAAKEAEEHAREQGDAVGRVLKAGAPAAGIEREDAVIGRENAGDSVGEEPSVNGGVHKLPPLSPSSASSMKSNISSSEIKKSPFASQA